ncbi:MAG: LuxR C-terminal-related transcriptional regulator [Pseudomonadota bacterium]
MVAGDRLLSGHLEYELSTLLDAEVGCCSDMSGLEQLIEICVGFDPRINFWVTTGNPLKIVQEPWCRAPNGWKDDYHVGFLSERDPITLAALSRKSVVKWRVSDLLTRSNELESAVLRTYATYGLETGLAIPVFDRFLNCDVVVVACRDDISPNLSWHFWHSAMQQIWSRKIELTETVSDTDPLLTPKELLVLKWMHAGKSYGDISTILGMSQRAVEFHARNILGKLNSGNKINAILTAIRRGLIPL